MQFTRSFHFYAAHRNQHLSDKCAGLHGHRYQVDFDVNVKRNEKDPAISILFNDFTVFDDHMKYVFDHTTLLDVNDPLADVLAKFISTDASGHHWRLRFLPFPTSLENMAFVIYEEMLNSLSNLVRPATLLDIRVRETDSTTICYDPVDFRKDKAAFEKDHQFWPMQGMVSLTNYSLLRDMINAKRTATLEAESAAATASSALSVENNSGGGALHRETRAVR